MNDELERVDIPVRMIGLIERRTKPIIRACVNDANMIRTIVMSCYLQGLEDGYEAARRSERNAS